MEPLAAGSVLSFTHAALEYLDKIWVWMTPGISALASAAPIATPVVAFFAAIYAVRTFQLKLRVDHGDQWLKRFQEGLAKSLSDDLVEQEFGSKLLATLTEPERPWLIFDPKKRSTEDNENDISGSANFESGKSNETGAVPAVATESEFYAKFPGLRPAGDSTIDCIGESSGKPEVVEKVESEGEFTEEKPTFVERGRRYLAYRKARRVSWNVSPAEVEMHRAISLILQNKALGIDGQISNKSNNDHCTS